MRGKKKKWRGPSGRGSNLISFAPVRTLERHVLGYHLKECHTFSGILSVFGIKDASAPSPDPAGDLLLKEEKKKSVAQCARSGKCIRHVCQWGHCALARCRPALYVLYSHPPLPRFKGRLPPQNKTTLGSPSLPPLPTCPTHHCIHIELLLHCRSTLTLHEGFYGL